MLKIKWECIPSVFTHAAKDADEEVYVFVGSPLRRADLWDGGKTVRKLTPEEYEDTGTEWDESLTTRAEWEARLWKDAPAKTVCHATDADGKSYWYSSVPHIVDAKWERPGRCEAANCCFSRFENWKDSLRKRPISVESSTPEAKKPVTMTITIDGYSYPISVECIIQSVKEYLEKQKREMT